MRYKPESAIWLRVIGQRRPCFDRCQLTILWMFIIKEVSYEARYKLRLHVSVNLTAGV